MQLPAPLNELSLDALSVLEPYLESVRFRAGDCLFRMGSAADACYVVDDGEVRIEIEREDIDTDTVLTYLGPGSLLGEIVGQSAQAVAHNVGIRRPYPVRLLVVETDSTDAANPYAGEIMAPLLSMFTVSGEEPGLAVCRALLCHTGAGHTAIVHTRDMSLVERFANQMRASRILVNAPGTQGSCGIATGLECSFTLGCGTFGGNSTADNVTYDAVASPWHHLQEQPRIAVLAR
jgi:hypothetical protein